MNKYIKQLLSLAAVAMVSWGCEADFYNEHMIDGYEPETEITDVQSVELTLTADDYSTISKNSTNKANAAAAGQEAVDALAAIGKNKYFANQDEAAAYIPAYLASAYPTFDNNEMMSILKEERKQNSDLIVMIDGLDHLKIDGRLELDDIHERRSFVMLDLYKSLDIPLFLGGELIPTEEGFEGPRPYLRDSDAIYWLDSQNKTLTLSVNSNRLGVSHKYNCPIFIDPMSNKMQEAE